MALFEHFPYTNFQDLNIDELLRHMRELLSEMRDLGMLVGGYNDRITALENYIRQLENGDFSESFLEGIYKWLDENVPEIINKYIQMVWFGLTDTGYFVAYIPQTWQDIQFNTTDYDIETELMPEYGHLVISSRGVI